MPSVRTRFGFDFSRFASSSPEVNAPSNSTRTELSWCSARPPSLSNSSALIRLWVAPESMRIGDSTPFTPISHVKEVVNVWPTCGIKCEWTRNTCIRLVRPLSVGLRDFRLFVLRDGVCPSESSPSTGGGTVAAASVSVCTVSEGDSALPFPSGAAGPTSVSVAPRRELEFAFSARRQLESGLCLSVGVDSDTASRPNGCHSGLPKC